MSFDPNLGASGRAARLLIGGLPVVLALMGTISAWGWIGLVLILTAALRFCPMYRWFGIDTRLR